MSGGPMPPPPCEWHPMQLKAANSRFPSLSAHAFSPYGPSLDTPLSGVTAFADSAATDAAGGESWNVRRSRPHAASAATTSTTSARGARSTKREHIERASLRRHVRQVAHRTHESKRGGRVPRIEAARDDRAGPSAHTREHRDVLLSIRPAIRNRLPDDPGRRLVLPQERTRARIHRLEPSLHRAVEHHVARRGERA